MSPADALARAQCHPSLLKYGRHARKRMLERRVREADVVCAIRTASVAVWREEEKSWRIEGGHTIDGQLLVVCVAFYPNGDIVVSVF